MYYERHLEEVSRMGKCTAAAENSAFKMMPFECSSNGIHGSFQWSKLHARLEKLHASLMAALFVTRSVRRWTRLKKLRRQFEENEGRKLVARARKHTYTEFVEDF